MNIKNYRSFFYLDVLWNCPDKVFGNKADDLTFHSVKLLFLHGKGR